MSSDPKPAGAIEGTEVGRSPVTGLKHLEIVTQLVEFPPSATSPHHFHHGKEKFYVLEGGTAQEPAQPPRERIRGEHGGIPRGVHHSGYTVIGDRNIKVLSVYVVDKGKSPTGIGLIADGSYGGRKAQAGAGFSFSAFRSLSVRR
uniref:cupin domain-containing protein n=1 Tax=Methylobacterium sp. B34 TaxID=95563 RepID=UPI001650F898|nr:cupin domain-containing protein [Methylobacterium sp. B34]